MSARPSAHPTLLSELVKVVPARLTKKLDASPRAADAWTWATGDGTVTVKTDTNETVTLPSTEVETIADVRCTCLLSPRCFHVLATIAVLAVDEPSVGEDASDVGASTTDVATSAAEPPVRDRIALSAAQRDAGAAAFSAGERVIVAGATGSGAVIQGELLRAAHAARTCGLHRLGSAALRACRTLRGLREESAEVTLPGLAADLRELLSVAWVVREDRATAADVGIARRAYDTLGNLVLTGLFSEPVIGNGYAGVVTTVCDGKGRLFTIRDVMPGEPHRARSAYGLAIRMGDTSIPHDELVREGLFVESATASADGRLGAGSKVKAARRGATPFDTQADLFTVPIATQIARAYDAPAGDDRPETADLVFLEIEILGSDTHAVHVRATPPGPTAFAPVLRLVPAHDAPELAFIDNLRLLGRAPGLRARIAARVLLDRPGTLAPLLLAPPRELVDGAPRLALPAAWSDRACLGFDRLQNAHIVRTAPGVALPFAPEPVRRDPLAALRRRLERTVLGGARTLTPGALRGVDDERRELGQAMMPHGADVLGAFATGAATGRETGKAWLALAMYENATTRALLRDAFGG